MVIEIRYLLLVRFCSSFDLFDSLNLVLLLVVIMGEVLMIECMEGYW